MSEGLVSKRSVLLTVAVIRVFEQVSVEPIDHFSFDSSSDPVILVAATGGQRLPDVSGLQKCGVPAVLRADGASGTFLKSVLRSSVWSGSRRVASFVDD